MLYRQLSKLAVVGERSEAPKANQSRLRRPTPYSIEHYRHEGVRASKDDNPPVESPRGRSTSTTWTPTRTRAPTPHPNASRSRPGKEKKTVRWTDSLEQESPEQKCNPAPAPSRTKSAMKKQSATQEKEDESTEKEEDRHEDSAQAPSKKKSEASSQVTQSCALRRDRRSSIPRPKFAVTVSRSNTSKRIAAAERPPSPLIPQAVPDPLRLSQRRSRVPTIPSSASAPVVTGKTTVRDFSFDNKPEVITVGAAGSADQYRPLNTTQDSLMPPQSTSYLQAKPRRAGTIRPPPTKAEREPAHAEDRREIKTSDSAAHPTIKATGSLPKSSSTQSFHSAKVFWAKKSASASVGDNNQDASNSKPASKPTPANSKLAAVDDPVDVISTCNRSSPSKPLPTSTSTSSFNSAKSFWSGLASSSTGAVVSGDSSETPKPALPRNVRDLPKTSMVSSLSSYTVNEGGRTYEKRARGGRKGDMGASVSSTAVKDPSKLSAKLSSGASSYRSAKSKSDVTTTGKRSSSKIPLPKPQHQSKLTAGSSVITTKSTTSSSTYHTAPSHLSTTSTSDIDANAPSSMAAIPTIQCELWSEIMNFCRSDSSSIPPGERYCDCGDCVWSNEKDLKECSTVARVGGGNCRAKRN